MEHKQYNGYPEMFSYVGCIGEGVIRNLQFSERKERKLWDDFFSDLETYGYYVITPLDGEKFEKAVEVLNEASRRFAISLSFGYYDSFILNGEINRCGKWVFLTPGRYTNDGRSVKIKQGRGGRREGSGRKSSVSALRYDNKTTTIRVPEIFKDTFKKMSALFIEQASSGEDIKRVLSSASWQLKDKAKEYRESEYKSDITESWAKECDQACELIDKLYDLIPSIYVKEECIKNGNVTESNNNEL